MRRLLSLVKSTMISTVATGLLGKAVREGGVEELHHQHWQLGAMLEVDPQELYHTRVVQAAQQLTFFCKPLQHGCPLLGVGRVEQELVDFLTHTLEATKLEFLDSGIRSSPDYSPCVTHSMELKLPQGASIMGSHSSEEFQS